MKLLSAVLAFGTLALSASSLRADLLGSTVSGTLRFGTDTTNYFDPANGFVPANYGNSTSPNNVVIGPGVEFGFDDMSNRDIANFTNLGLTVRDVCLPAAIPCNANTPFTMTFTDTAFATATLLTNDLGVSYSLAGDVLTVRYPGGMVPDENATATFSIGSVAPTPEPGTLGLMATGLLGVAGAVRRRLHA